MGISPNPPATMMTGQPSTHKSTSKTDDNDDDNLKLQSFTEKKNSTHDDDGSTQHSPHVVDLGCLLALDDDASTDINVPLHACISSQPPNMRSTLQETPFRTLPRKSKFCNVGATSIWGVASGYECMVSVLRYSPQAEHPGCGVLVRVQCMWVSSTNECTLILFCRRDEAKVLGIW